MFAGSRGEYFLRLRIAQKYNHSWIREKYWAKLF
jgi:hypothetical protein